MTKRNETTASPATPQDRWRRNARIALYWAAAIAGYCLLVTLFAGNGTAEDKIFGPYGIFRKTSIVLSFPAVLLWRMWAHGPGDYIADTDAFALLVPNFVAYWLLIFGVISLVGWWRRLPDDPHSVQRRRLLVGSALGLGAVGGAFYLRKDCDTVEVVSQKLTLPHLSPAMRGWKLVLMADWHRGPFVGMDYLQRVVELCNAQNPDIVCIVGDFVYEDPKYFADVGALLRRIKARVALLGTLGNHDHWQGGLAKAAIALEPAGLRFVDNTRLFITPEGRISAEPVQAALCVAGVGDEWEDTVDYGAALQGVPEELPRLVLTHNPDAAESPGHDKFRVDAMLAGHTHGGQVALPVLGTVLVPTKYGDKYVAGWCQGPAFPVYTNRGIGMTVLPIRSGSRPEITVFTLQ